MNPFFAINKEPTEIDVERKPVSTEENSPYVECCTWVFGLRNRGETEILKSISRVKTQRRF